LPLTTGAPTLPSARRGIPWPFGKRVIVIEDNIDGCEMMRLLLEQAGYEVFCANDGKSGLETIEKVRPDIAIVDIGLPLMNGFDLARHVRARGELKNLYLVALTGYGQASDHAAALDAGFDEHLVKPLDPDELTRLVRQSAPSFERV
jgi:DNA-binding response OmpR family regulator